MVAGADFAFLRDMANLDSVVVKGLPKEQAAYWPQRNKKYDLLRPDLSGH